MKRKTALITGMSILVMAIIAGFAYSFVFKRIYILNDAATTVSNLKDLTRLFRIMIFSYVVILILDVKNFLSSFFIPSYCFILLDEQETCGS